MGLAIPTMQQMKASGVIDLLAIGGDPGSFCVHLVRSDDGSWMGFALPQCTPDSNNGAEESSYHMTAQGDRLVFRGEEPAGADAPENAIAIEPAGPDGRWRVSADGEQYEVMPGEMPWDRRARERLDALQAYLEYVSSIDGRFAESAAGDWQLAGQPLDCQQGYVDCALSRHALLCSYGETRTVVVEAARSDIKVYEFPREAPTVAMCRGPGKRLGFGLAGGRQWPADR